MILIFGPLGIVIDLVESTKQILFFDPKPALNPPLASFDHLDLSKPYMHICS